jgi:hypothetical protein
MDARLCFSLEIAATTVGSALFAVTLLWPDWIERVFGADPDGTSGLDDGSSSSRRCRLPSPACSWQGENGARDRRSWARS